MDKKLWAMEGIISAVFLLWVVGIYPYTRGGFAVMNAALAYSAERGADAVVLTASTLCWFFASAFAMISREL